MRAPQILGLTLAATLPGCVVDMGDVGDDLATDEAAVCVVTFGAHEICDGVDNDCDGTIDEVCGPIDPMTIAPYTCDVAAGFIGVGNAGAVFVAHAMNPQPDHLDRIDASGVITHAVNTTVPDLGYSQIARGPAGRMFLGGFSSNFDGPSQYIWEVTSFSPDTGAHVSLAAYYLADWELQAFAVDARGRFYASAGSRIYHWDGSSFIPWASTNGARTMVLSADGTSMFTGGSIFGPVLSRSTPGSPPVVLEQSLMIDGVNYYTNGLVRDDAGRLYLSVFKLTPGQGGAVLRYDADGTNRVLIAATTAGHVGPMAYDHATHRLIVRAGACPGSGAAFRRLPL